MWKSTGKAKEESIRNIVSFIITSNKDNGVFKYKLKTRWESIVYRLFCLSRKSNGFGTEIEYQVVKDFCIEEELETLEMYEVLKNINYKVAS